MKTEDTSLRYQKRQQTLIKLKGAEIKYEIRRIIQLKAEKTTSISKISFSQIGNDLKFSLSKNLRILLLVFLAYFGLIQNSIAQSGPGQDPVQFEFIFFLPANTTSTLSVSDIAYSPTNQDLYFDLIIDNQGGTASISNDGMHLYYYLNQNDSLPFNAISVNICDDGNGNAADVNCQVAAIFLVDENLLFYYNFDFYDAIDDVFIIELGNTSANFFDVLSNDLFEFGDYTDLQIEIVEDPIFGIASPNNFTATYIPSGNPNVEYDYFSYRFVNTITSEVSDTAVVNIYFEDFSNQEFTAVDDYYEINPNFLTPIFPSFNDMYTGIPIIEIVTEPVNGEADVSDDGYVVGYVPDTNFYGLDSFQYIIYDLFAGSNNSDVAWVYIEVNNTYTCEFCVLPGDCNDSGLANYKDLLNIGLNFNSIGPPREYGDIGFFFQFASNFPEPIDFSFDLNPKFADANGDGIINEIDVDVLDANYGLYAITLDSEVPIDVNGPELNFHIDEQVYRAGDTVIAPLHFGNSIQSIQNLYGLAFKINFDNLIIDESKIKFITNDGWLNADTDDLIEIQKISDNTIEVAFSKTNKDGISGFGDIGYAAFIIEEILIGEIDLVNTSDINISDVLAVNETGDTILANPIQSSITYSTHDVVDISEKNIIPMFDILTSEQEINIVNKYNKSYTISIIDLNGKTIDKFNIDNLETININKNKYSPGMYNIMADKQFLIKFINK